MKKRSLFRFSKVTVVFDFYYKFVILVTREKFARKANFFVKRSETYYTKQ